MIRQHLSGLEVQQEGSAMPGMQKLISDTLYLFFFFKAAVTVVSLADNPSEERIPLLRACWTAFIENGQSWKPAMHTQKGQSDPPQIKEQIRDGNGNIKQPSQFPNSEKPQWHSDHMHSEMKICPFVAFPLSAHFAAVTSITEKPLIF